LEISGEYQLGEARGAEWLLSRQVSGFGLGRLWLFLGTLIGAELAAGWIGDRMDPSHSASFPLVVMVGVLGVYGWTMWRRRNLTRGWIGRGVRRSSPLTFRIDDAGFMVEGPAAEVRWRWDGISEIARGKGFWCVIGPGLGYCLPRRFFADQTAERAFLRAMLERMTEAARARSGDAIAYIGPWG
jgi:hypothetical protein